MASVLPISGGEEEVVVVGVAWREERVKSLVSGRDSVKPWKPDPEVRDTPGNMKLDAGSYV